MTVCTQCVLVTSYQAVIWAYKSLISQRAISPPQNLTPAAFRPQGSLQLSFTSEVALGSQHLHVPQERVMWFPLSISLFRTVLLAPRELQGA